MRNPLTTRIRGVVLAWLPALMILSPPGGLIAADADATAVMADGKLVSGSVVAMDPQSIRLSVAGSEMRLELDDLSSLRLDHPALTGPAGQVWLVGGSQIRIENAVLESGQDAITLRPRRQANVAVPLAMVRAIRFRGGTPTTDPVWLGLIAEGPRVDRLIARRGESSLEPIDGAVEGISRDAVSFLLSGNTIKAPLTKLEGVVFGGVATADEAAIRVEDVYGSNWVARSIEMSAAASGKTPELRLDLAEGVTHRLPIDQVLSIQFRGGILALADAEIAKQQLKSIVPGFDGSKWNAWLGPRMDAGAVTMTADSSITFRLPDGYQRLVGSVRRNADVSQFGQTDVALWVDDEPVWQARLGGRETLGFELPIRGGRRFTVEVSGGDDSTVGDLVDWVDVRLLK